MAIVRTLPAAVLCFCRSGAAFASPCSVSTPGFVVCNLSPPSANKGAGGQLLARVVVQ